MLGFWDSFRAICGSPCDAFVNIIDKLTPRRPQLKSDESDDRQQEGTKKSTTSGRVLALSWNVLLRLRRKHFGFAILEVALENLGKQPTLDRFVLSSKVNHKISFRKCSTVIVSNCKSF